MSKIETFVIIDLETTGLPHKEYNRTKITEMCLLAASRKDIKETAFGKLPPMSKLSFILNPEKPITPDSARITGITDKRVKNSLTFREKFNTINSFLKDLKKPVCLVAHNGNIFDYRILLSECVDASVSLPYDLLCVDSLTLFRKISPNPATIAEKNINSVDKRVDSDRSINGALLSDIMTEDEDEWPQLNVTPEEYEEIDDLCSSFSKMSPSQNTAQNKSRTKKMDNKTKAQKSDGKKPSFKLSEIYKRYFGGMDDKTAHRAEDDCLMLLQCMVAVQEEFLKLSDRTCKLLTECKPLERKVINTVN